VWKPVSASQKDVTTARSDPGRRLLAVLTDAVAPRRSEDAADGDTPTARPAAEPPRTPLAQFAHVLAQRSAYDRLWLRSQLRLDELRLIHLLAGLLLAADALARDLDQARPRDLARTLGQVIDRAATFDVELAHAHAIALTRDIGYTVDAAIARARILVQALDTVRDRDYRRIHNIDRVLFRDRARDLVLAIAATLDVTVDLAADIRVPGQTFELRGRVRKRDHDISRTINLGRHVTGGLRRHVTRARDLLAGLSALDAAVTDFTTADLAHVDLRGIDLRGVRWSRLTTHWPLSWVEAIREASVRIDPDHRPDLYEIRGGHPARAGALS
jgi:hypothetical protein